MIKALVADDDEALRSLVCQVLESDGYSVVVAADGDEAWRLFEEHLPELVFTDIRMPGRTGLDLLAEIKRKSSLAHVIIMTSHASLDTAIGALKKGAYDYLIKPFEDLELISGAARRAVGSLRLLHERELLVTKLQEYNEELEKLNKMFRELAVKDGLTGLFNHRYAQESLLQEVERSRLHRRPLSVLFADVDHFKQYNDQHGHQMGDRLLRSLAGCLKGVARSTDIIARWGGEEFVVIAPESDLQVAMDLAWQMRDAVASLEDPGRSTQPQGIISVSIGVATLGVHADSAAALIAQADQALYRCKAAGRNTVLAAEGHLDDVGLPQAYTTTSRRKILAT